MEMKSNEHNWKMMYKIGMVAIFLSVFVMVAEMFLTMLPDGARSNEGSGDIYSWFAQFDRNWFMAMRNLGLINIIATTLTLPAFFALLGLHYEKNRAFAGMVLIVYLMSYAVFMADNVAFPMLALSQKYAVADPAGRRILLSAGEALLAKGISHTPGTFPGFFLGIMSSIFMSVLIIPAGIFHKRVGVIGIVAFSFMLIFEVLASFYSGLFSVAMIFAVVGGILALTWYVMLGIGLYKASK